MRRAIIALAAFLLFARLSSADSFQSTLAAAQSGNAGSQDHLGYLYEKGQGVAQSDAEAAQWYAKAAAQGNASGEQNLGRMYKEGRGVSKNDAEAARYFRLSANQGNAWGQINLAQMLRDGRGVPKSDADATRYFRLSADKGNADAQHSLGEMYRDGRGVLKNDAAALDLFRRSAAQGNAWGELDIGEMYGEGRGVTQDLAQAAQWYRKVAARGNPVMQNALGELYRDGKGAPKDDGEAVRLFRLAAKQGNAWAQVNLGRMHGEGRGVPQSFDEAATYYRLAAEQGDPALVNAVATRYRDAVGVMKNEAEAVRLFRLAADKGYLDAQANLGAMYKDGHGVTQSGSEALRWLRPAADKGNATAQVDLGWMYADGQGVPKNEADAVHWYTLAAEQGNSWADSRLGSMYKDGRGVPQDYAKAVQLFTLSAERGDASGQNNLGLMYKDGLGVARNTAEAARLFRLAAAQGRADAAQNLGTLVEVDPLGKALRAQETALPAALPALNMYIAGADTIAASAVPAGFQRAPKKSWVAPLGALVVLFFGVSLGLAFKGGGKPQPESPERPTAEAPVLETPAEEAPKQQEPEFQRRSPSELRKLALGSPAPLDAVMAEYIAAREADELIEDLAPLTEKDGLPALARSLLRCGDYDSSYKLLLRLPRPAEPERQIKSSIEKLVRLRRPGSMFNAQQGYGERLTLANAFTGMKLNDEAIGVIDEATLVAAGREEMDAGAVAGHFHRADKAARLVELASRTERVPDFYSNYANALHVWGSDEAALALLQKKTTKTWEAGDYALLVAIHRALGTLGRIDVEAMPEPQRVLVAEGFLDEGKPERSLDVLGGVSKPVWRVREYGTALRSLGKLDRYEAASALYQDIQKSAPVGQAPELHYLFAVLCERAGKFERAKAVYRDILAGKSGYKDASQRLENLEAISAEEEGRVTTMLASAVTMVQSPGEAAAVLKGLEEQERSGAIAGRLVLLRPAGVGGMGIVYKARDLKLQREVAVKRLRGELAANPALRRGMLEEAKTLSALSHPNIVSYFGNVEAGGVTYLIFEFVEGETLRDVVVARGRLPARDAVKLLLPVCSALEHAHGRGIVHRDIKPGNVMVDQKAEVKVMDFGLARQAAESGAVETRVAGTPAYMPPEQYDGKVTSAADIFAYGATAYELLTGTLPYQAGELMSSKLREGYAPLPDDVPKALADLVGQCLKPDPGARPQAGAVRAALASILESPIAAGFRA
jgi:TPR repeat protein/tRNA A-37 threonylcarbamoyl transferase component Bud32